MFGIALPRKKLPIYIIGAGGIVQDAHLPAYRLAGFEVRGISDLELNKAKKLANDFQIPEVFENLSEMVNQADTSCIYDLAVPGSVVLSVLNQLPNGAHVLIQKPMGENQADAEQILALCRAKNLNAGINFQLRYAPFVAEARQMMAAGMIGEITDFEISVNVYTPWHLWDFLFTSPRVEILYHSIHYLDLARSMLGNPTGIYARTWKHPQMEELASVRTSMILDYGEYLRCNILTNHCHQFGLENQHSYIKVEGTKGAIKMNFGVLKNYPQGEPDRFEFVLLDNSEPKWQTKSIDGTWFPHAFIGSMSEVMKAATGEKSSPDNSVEDCIDTMRWVERAYESSDRGGLNG